MQRADPAPRLLSSPRQMPPANAKPTGTAASRRPAVRPCARHRKKTRCHRRAAPGYLVKAHASRLAAVTAAAPAYLHMAVVMMVPAHRDHARAPYRVAAVIVVGDVTFHIGRPAARTVELDVNPRRAVVVPRFRGGRGNHGGDTEGEDSDQLLHVVELGFTVSDDMLPHLFKIAVVFSCGSSKRSVPFPWRGGRSNGIVPLNVTLNPS